MTREADVVQSLVDLADTLVDDYDVVDLLTGLADRCVHVLGAAAAGVMVASSSGDLRLVASSSETMRVLELFELQAMEGPCLDAFRTGERVEHEHLQGGTGRWPRFSMVALEAGFPGGNRAEGRAPDAVLPRHRRHELPAGQRGTPRPAGSGGTNRRHHRREGSVVISLGASAHGGERCQPPEQR